MALAPEQFRVVSATPVIVACGGKLNRDGIAGPRCRGWGASTINGNATRGTGILNNRIYIGKLVWNKLRYVKDPDTQAVIEKDVPHLLVIEQDLWNAVKQRQAEVMLGPQSTTIRPWDRRRPRYLLSGLVKCGACDGGYVQISKTHLGCATSRNKGTASCSRGSQPATSRPKRLRLYVALSTRSCSPPSKAF
jgi:site-specific DNA recombinase